MLCSVLKHLASGRALEKQGKTIDHVSCIPLHVFRALPLPACFTREQSTVEASLFVKQNIVCLTLVKILFLAFWECFANSFLSRFCRYFILSADIFLTTQLNTYHRVVAIMAMNGRFCKYLFAKKSGSRLCVLIFYSRRSLTKLLVGKNY